ncbi:uncharacterized protein [Musca autumnalis]|uniref:uncharacterized protein n=1 Tax=Musca autumnalis TaxID=221902 RepID=UPI003CE8BEE8
MHGKESARRKWLEITEELNKIPGAVKSSDQWQTVWRDLKSKTSTKFKTLKRERNATGNKPLTKGLLTPIEERVVGIVGLEYMMGNEDCPDSLDVELAKDVTELLDDSTKNADDIYMDIEALDEEVDELPQCSSSKRLRDVESLSHSKRPKKDNKEGEFLKIAKTQAEAMLTQRKH